MKKLKPCPFCGTDALTDYQSQKGSFRIVCNAGWCKVNPETQYRETKKEASELWNYRTLETEKSNF